MGEGTTIKGSGVERPTISKVIKEYKAVLGPNFEVIPCYDLMEWAMWFETHGKERIVEQTYFGDIMISTVFLGINHGFFAGDLWFETLVFGSDLDGDGDRYPNVDIARKGHAEWVEKVEKVLGSK